MPNTIRREKTFNIAADRLLFSGHNAGVDGDVHIDMADNNGTTIFGSNLAVMDDKKILQRNIYDLGGDEVFELANDTVKVKYANGIDCDSKPLTNANVDSGTVDGISSLTFQSGASVSFAGATNGLDFGNVTITNFNLPASSLEPSSIGSNNGFSTLEDELDQNRTETLTALGRTQAPHLSANKVLISNGSGLLVSSSINPSTLVKTTDVLALSQIPSLPASRVDEGAFHEDRIPPLPAARIISGTLDAARIPSLDAAKVTSGTFDAARVPSLDASKVTTGTFDAGRVPSLDAAKVTSGTFDAARVPSLDAAKVTSGTFDAARVPSLDASKITTGTISDARLNPNILRNNFSNQTLTANGFTIDGGNSGDAVLTLKADGDNNNESDNAFLDFLQDGGTLGTQTGTRGRIGLDGLNNMFCGITTDSFFFGGVELRTHGSGTGSNYKPVAIKAHNTHTVNLDHLGVDILSGYNLRIAGSQFGFNHMRSGSVATDAQIPSLNTSKLTAGVLDTARLPTTIAYTDDHINLAAGKVYKVDNQQIGFEDLRSGSVATDAQLPTNLARDDDHIDLPSGKEYRIDSAALNFSHLAGSLVTGQLPTTVLHSNAHVNIASGQQFQIDSQQLGFNHLRSGSVATDAQLPTNLARDDDHINLPTGKEYRINSQALNFSHLAGSASDAQLPTTVLHSDEHVNIAAGKQFQINSQPLNFSDLAGTFTDSQLPATVLHSDEHVNIASGKEFQINSAALNFSHLAGSVADSQLSTNIPRLNANLHHFENTDQNGSEFRFTAKNGFQGEAKFVIERRDILNNLIQRLTMERATNDWAFRNSHASGGFQLLNNENDALLTTSDTGTNVKGALTAEAGMTVEGGNLIQQTSPMRTASLGNVSAAGTLTATGVLTANAGVSVTGDVASDTVTTNTVTTSRINFNDDDHSDTTTFPRIEDFQDSLMYNVETGERHEFQVNAQRYARVMSDGLHVMNGSVDRIHLKHTGEIVCHKADDGATLQLENGQLSNPTGGESQIAFSYNGNATFRHFIRSRHASGNPGNSLDFLINQQSASADLNDSGCEEVFRIRQDSIDCLKPILNNAGAGQYGRFLTTMNMGESFIDSTKVLKMSCAMYRLNSLPTDPQKFITLNDMGGNTDTFTGLGNTIGEAYTSNPGAIIVNHSSTDMNSSSHTNSAIHVVRYGSSGNDPFGASYSDGQNTVVTGRGYLYKQASGTNPFETAVKNAERTLWQVRTKTDDDFKLTVNGESIQVYEYGNNENITSNASFYKNSIFEMHGDYAFIEYRNINGSGGAYVNLVFQCLGTV